MDPITIAMGLAQFVPSITKWLTGSDTAANVASKVVDIAKTVTGQDADGAAAALKADPALVIQFQQAVMASSADLEKAYLLDVQSARSMQVAALAQGDTFSKRFVYYFAALWSVFAMGYFAAVTFIPIPPAGQRVADTILGVLISSVLGGIFGYFYGSTKGSADKTAALTKAATR